MSSFAAFVVERLPHPAFFFREHFDEEGLESAGGAMALNPRVLN